MTTQIVDMPVPDVPLAAFSLCNWSNPRFSQLYPDRVDPLVQRSPGSFAFVGVHSIVLHQDVDGLEAMASGSVLVRARDVVVPVPQGGREFVFD